MASPPDAPHQVAPQNVTPHQALAHSGAQGHESGRLAANIITAGVDGGRIGENIMHFARVLRAAGLAVGPEKVVRATTAVMAAGIADPKILYWTLHACFVTRRSEHEVFTQAYVMFWKDPEFLQQMLSLMLPSFRPPDTQPGEKALSRRVAESLFRGNEQRAPQADERVEVEARGTFSAADVSQTKDFDQMSAAELARARRAIADLHMPFAERRTRRTVPATSGGGFDLRRMLRETARTGELGRPRYRKKLVRPTPIVILCDISGSMDSYARVMLHFAHTLAESRGHVSTFLFGTVLTNVSRLIATRDPDVALARVSKGITDWAGGTRIGAALEAFNKHWARRVLGQGAVVLLVTDGLDREGGDGIAKAARRLAAMSRRLIWLNPLLRYDRYEPIAAGAAALAAHAGQARPCHNLESLADLASALDGIDGRRGLNSTPSYRSWR